MPLLAVAIVGAATGGPAFAQTTGDITGTVTDSSGAALPGVTCTATSASLQGTRSSVTGNSGNYRIASLPPGTYKVSCALAGFSTVERTANVSLGGTATVNQTLQISQREEVVVSGQAPVVDTTNTTGGSNYSAKVMEKLPLGRNYANVAKMQPGVNEDTGDQQGRGLALSIYGSTSAENVFVIDGVNTNSVVRGVQGKVINNEFIQEVEVKTGGYQAEFGRSTGGIINVITKSGGNEFHGDVFGNFSPSSFRSDQRHDDGDKFNTTFDEVQELDYGVDLGGFIVKDRLWFFTAYDRIDNERDRVPKDSPSVLNQHFLEEDNYNLFSGKLTWNIVQGSTLVGTYFRDPEVRTGAVFTPTGTDPNSYAGRQDIGSEDYAGRFNQLFGSFGVLTLQYSKHNDKFRFKPLDPTRAGIQDRTVAADYPNHPIFVGFGAVPGFRLNNEGERDEYIGNFTAYFGNHELKFGGDYVDAVTTDNSFYTGQQRIRVYNCSTNPASSSFCPAGEGVNFTNYQGDVRRVYFQHAYYTDSSTGFDLLPFTNSAPPSQGWSAFIQDSWRIMPRLTLNAGVRYDTEQIKNGVEETVIDLKDMWQPRVGLVYDWKGDGSSKLYASFGRFYYMIPNDLNVRVYGAQFTRITWNYDGPHSFNEEPPPGGYGTAQGGPGTGPPRRNTLVQGAADEPVDEGIKGQYQDEFTLGGEMALTPTFAVGVKGMYRKLGRAIEDRCDLDGGAAINQGSTCAMVNPGKGGLWGSGNFPWCDNAGDPFVSPSAGECSTDPDASIFGAPTPAIPAASRKFRGVELTARKTFSQNLWAQASYIYSKLSGNYDGAVRVASGQTDPGINADYDYFLFSRNGNGRLYLDRPHQFRLDAVYTAPFGLNVGLGAYYRSGPPVSRYGWYNVFYPDLLHLVPRGSDNTVSNGRLTGQYEANISLGWTFNMGAVSITPQLYVFNLLDRQGVTDIVEEFNPDGTFCLDTAGCGTQINPDTGAPWMTQRNFDRLGTVGYGQPIPQEDWAKPSARQDPRQIRAALKISF
ncbi:MAG TPA: TonB-dependent receptor [Thermoanaerobaculia bacterium]|nr:TonB-dependent receptor [Thermoanaerobaculia bacterium]